MRHATREPGLGARAAGPHPRRQARFPGDAGQRPALPGARSLRASTPGLGARTRRNKARRWCSPGPRAPARIRAARRGSPGMRASGPRSQGLVPCERPPRASVRGREGTRHGGGARRERGPPARIRAARRGSPGMRASGPRSQGSFHASVQPGAPVPDAQGTMRRRARRGADAREQGAPLDLGGSAGSLHGKPCAGISPTAPPPRRAPPPVPPR